MGPAEDADPEEQVLRIRRVAMGDVSTHKWNRRAVPALRQNIVASSKRRNTG